MASSHFTCDITIFDASPIMTSCGLISPLGLTSASSP